MKADEARQINKERLESILSDDAIKKQVSSIDRKIRLLARKGKNYIRISIDDESCTVIRGHYSDSGFLVKSVSDYWFDIKW